MNFKLNNETVFAQKMAKLIAEEQSMLIRKTDARELIRMYFQKKIHDERYAKVDMGALCEDLFTLLDDLPGYNLQRVTDQLTEKRQYSAVEIVRGGWNHGR